MRKIFKSIPGPLQVLSTTLELLHVYSSQIHLYLNHLSKLNHQILFIYAFVLFTKKNL